jgi:AAA family ATP:ADP antiporter
LKESLKNLLTSSYLGCIAILVIAYGMSINLIEVTWKSELKLQFPNPNDYSAFMGEFSRITGLVTMIMMFFVTGNVVRKLGWRVAALITPVILLVTGALFFTFMIFNSHLKGAIALIGTTPLWLAVIFGMAQNIMSKSAKYSLFDPTKEVKGKATVDVVGARFGKSGGAFIQQFLIITLGSISAMAPYIGIFLGIIITLWIIAVIALDKKFKIEIAKKEAEEKAFTV